MKLASFVNILESVAPTTAVPDWDNVGLLVHPSSASNVCHIFMTIDLTEEVLEEALECGQNGDKVDMIISYHPPIFKPFKRLTQSSAKERIILKCIESGIAVYSPHTAHDSIWGGINDWILKAFDDGTVSPISYNQTPDNQPIELLVSSFSDKTKANKVAESIIASGNVTDDNIEILVSENLSGISSYKLKCLVTETVVKSLIPMLKEEWPQYKISMSPSPEASKVEPDYMCTYRSMCHH